MRIAVLADTHVNKLEHLPKKIIDAVSTVDLIIHAGDFNDIQLLNELKQLRKVKAVQGNMDSRELKIVLPVKEIIEIKNKRIGITHGSGAPWGIEERVKKSLSQTGLTLSSIAILTNLKTRSSMIFSFSTPERPKPLLAFSQSMERPVEK